MNHSHSHDHHQPNLTQLWITVIVMIIINLTSLNYESWFWMKRDVRTIHFINSYTHSKHGKHLNIVRSIKIYFSTISSNKMLNNITLSWILSFVDSSIFTDFLFFEKLLPQQTLWNVSSSYYTLITMMAKILTNKKCLKNGKQYWKKEFIQANYYYLPDFSSYYLFCL